MLAVDARKRCYKCKQELPLGEFHKNRTRKDGLDHHCKKCKKRHAREYREENRDRLIQRSKEWRKNNPGKNLLYCREYRRDHREEVNQHNREYRSTILGYLANVFYCMGRRCNNPKVHNYHRYGGRSIKNKFRSLDEFRNYVIEELRVDPRGLQIDRIDNDGHYEKGNIRFVTAKENCNNRGEAQNR